MHGMVLTVAMVYIRLVAVPDLVRQAPTDMSYEVPCSRGSLDVTCSLTTACKAQRSGNRVVYVFTVCATSSGARCSCKSVDNMVFILCMWPLNDDVS